MLRAIPQKGQTKMDDMQADLTLRAIEALADLLDSPGMERVVSDDLRYRIEVVRLDLEDLTSSS